MASNNETRRTECLKPTHQKQHCQLSYPAVLHESDL